MPLTYLLNEVNKPFVNIQGLGLSFDDIRFGDFHENM